MSTEISKDAGVSSFDEFIKEKTDPVTPIGMTFEGWYNKAKEIDGISDQEAVDISKPEKKKAYLLQFPAKDTLFLPLFPMKNPVSTNLAHLAVFVDIVIIYPLLFLELSASLIKIIP